MSQPLIYLVDDEEQILQALYRTLMSLPVEIKTFSSPSSALTAISEEEPVLIISDQRMPFMTGLEFLGKIAQSHPKIHRVLLSAYQDFDVVIDGFNHGYVQQFLSKPWKNNEIRELVASHLKQEEKQANDSIKFIGESPEILSLKEQIKTVADANVPIFIHGETGTGKELVAKSLHSCSTRAEHPYVAFNCANFSEHLLESQLFGHRKGAFTGADKDFDGLLSQEKSGTVFLDEVTTLPLPIQAKLLRVIQEREYTPLGSSEVLPLKAQLVSASSMSLHQATQSGEFREDLFYRLAVMTLKIPKLSTRNSDIMLLANHFLQKFNQQHNKNIKGFDTAATAFIESYAWPGNVRQMENLIHQLVIIATSSEISKGLLEQGLGELVIYSSHESSNNESSDLSVNNQVTYQGGTLADIEKRAILAAIDACHGNISEAAVSLKVNPSTLYRKLQAWKSS